jgi:hypothetical protein
MKKMTREEKLRIARQIHKEIKAIEKKWQNQIDISICWDECLWINDEFFNYGELNEKTT